MACFHVCVTTLRAVQSEKIILDDQRLIIREYRSYANPSGQPGVGDEFFLWLLRNQANPEYVETVSITPDDDKGFVEFPDDPDLAKFDPSDRKFVAVALASLNQPEILNAVDTDWWHYREPLERNGVRIRFLCPDEIQKKRASG